MQKQAPRRGKCPVGLRILFLCIMPVLFLLLVTMRTVVSSTGQPQDFLAVLPPLGTIVAVSFLGLVIDAVAGCNGRCLVPQLAGQLLLVVYFLNESDFLLGNSGEHSSQQQLRRHVEAAELSASSMASGSISAASTALQTMGTQAAVTIPGSRDGMSIVIPCLNETSNAVNTVKSFCERTPEDLLEEIVVVDDGSSPSLEQVLKDQIPEKCRLRVLRHPKAMGLMIAKQTGGDAAIGKYIGFFDCHVAPNIGWYKEIVSLLNEKADRLVVPMIGDLNMTAWDQKHNGALTAKCYINFNADFWWYEDETDFIPVISGGLVATTRQWWQASGGFDKDMRGWGGENTEQSLRAWLCGGDIIRAKTSVIAHMWRVDEDRRTLAKYKLHFKTDNLARVAAGWFDDFYPKFRNGNYDSHLDVADIVKQKTDMHCKPFAYFIHRFRKLYVGGGVIPDKVFRIRDKHSKLCINKHGQGYRESDCESATWFHFGNMAPEGYPAQGKGGSVQEKDAADAPAEVVCGGHKAASCAACPQGHGPGWCHQDCAWFFGDCIDKTQDEEDAQGSVGSVDAAPQFSGIREWNTMNCFDRLDPSGPLAYFCDIHGTNTNQQYLLDAEGRLRHFTGKCVDLGASSKLIAGSCADATKWELISAFEPDESKLYREAVSKYHLSSDEPDH